MLVFALGYLILAVISFLIVVVLLRRAPVMEEEEWLPGRTRSTVESSKSGNEIVKHC